MGVNLDKPGRWKEDIARSVDLYNQWFLDFAPLTYRNERIKATDYIQSMLIRTNLLRNLSAGDLKENPSILAALRMCTAPPIARDRLIGLADASKTLVMTMEKSGHLPPRMPQAVIDQNLERIADMISRLIDEDIFPWIYEKGSPTIKRFTEQQLL